MPKRQPPQRGTGAAADLRRRLLAGNTAEDSRQRSGNQRQNRAERRRGQAEWRRRMQALVDDGAGLFKLEIVRPPDPTTELNFLLIRHWLHDVSAGDLRPVCVGCDTDIVPGGEHPHVFVLVWPDRNDPSVGCVAAGCRICAQKSDGALLDLAVRQWGGKRLPPEHMHASGGRA
jgi:hypothetical protein